MKVFAGAYNYPDLTPLMRPGVTYSKAGVYEVDFFHDFSRFFRDRVACYQLRYARRFSLVFSCFLILIDIYVLLYPRAVFFPEELIFSVYNDFKDVSDKI